MEIVMGSFSIIKTVATVAHAVVLAAFLTVILAVDRLTSIPAKWFLG